MKCCEELIQSALIGKGFSNKKYRHSGEIRCVNGYLKPASIWRGVGAIRWGMVANAAFPRSQPASKRSSRHIDADFRGRKKLRQLGNRNLAACWVTFSLSD